MIYCMSVPQPGTSKSSHTQNYYNFELPTMDKSQ